MTDKGRGRYPRWLALLAALGAVSVCGVVLTLFFALGRRPSALNVTDMPAVQDEEFLVSLAGTAGAPLRVGGTVELLDNGDEFFPALLRDLRGARSTINILVFIWEKGRASDQVMAVLRERAGAGVQVRILLDAYGGRDAPEKDMDALRERGGKVAYFRTPRLGKLTRFHKRTHRRALVVDGRIAYTGGMAIADKWLGHAESEEHWRDSMVRVTGPPAAAIQSAFAAPWAHSAGEILVGERFYPPLEDARGPGAIRTVGVMSAPTSDHHPLRLLFMQTFLAARRTLYITTPYFVPDRVTREAVAQKARSGVDVRILLPDEHTDAMPIRQTTHSYLGELLEAGVRAYEYQPTMMHTKHVVVDGVWSVVGSPNMDIRSKELNEENVLCVLDPALGARLDEDFRRDLARSEEITLDKWRRRGWAKRIVERGFRLFAEQY
ncbi:MAG TPA: phospholipase D-like domain-containing protein [Vicinamibacteria bacterium]|nr:phospholipase D-like domain-containing protein [Vicinamibacteria bacterium]